MSNKLTLDQIAHTLAYECALGAIEREGVEVDLSSDNSETEELWFDLSDELGKPILEDETRYLDSRGLLVRHSSNSNLVQVRDESEADEPKEIILPPAGMMTDEGAERVGKALKAFNDATADAANYFSQLWEECGIGTVLEEEDEFAEAVRILNARSNAQDEMLRAIAGCPSVAEVTR